MKYIYLEPWAKHRCVDKGTDSSPATKKPIDRNLFFCVRRSENGTTSYVHIDNWNTSFTHFSSICSSIMEYFAFQHMVATEWVPHLCLRLVNLFHCRFWLWMNKQKMEWHVKSELELEINSLMTTKERLKYWKSKITWYHLILQTFTKLLKKSANEKFQLQPKLVSMHQKFWRPIIYDGTWSFDGFQIIRWGRRTF